MRRVLLWLAATLPAPVVLRRIAPMVTTMAALVTAGWAVFTYVQHLRIDRVRAGLELQRQYRDIFGPAGAAGHLPALFAPEAMQRQVGRVMCSFLVGTARMEPPPGGCDQPTPELLARMQAITLEMPDSARADLRLALQRDQSAQNWPAEWHQKFAALLSFYQAMGICIAQNTCDAEVTLSLFQREVVPFLNATCAALDWDQVALADARALAQLIRESAPQGVYWDRDARRDDPFLCPLLRADQRVGRP